MMSQPQEPSAKWTYIYLHGLHSQFSCYTKLLTNEIKASTTVNQAMDPISQGAARKAHLKQKQWFLF